jgi:hypothetical protein
VQAFVQGTVVDGPATGELVVAVDGEIVTGSRLFAVEEEVHFLAMLPSDVAGRGFELRAAVIVPSGQAFEVTILES